MRAKITIDSDVLHAARALADAEGKTVGQVVSALARQGLATGFPTFRVSVGAPSLTPDMVRKAIDGDN